MKSDCFQGVDRSGLLRKMRSGSGKIRCWTGKLVKLRRAPSRARRAVMSVVGCPFGARTGRRDPAAAADSKEMYRPPGNHKLYTVAEARDRILVRLSEMSDGAPLDQLLPFPLLQPRRDRSPNCGSARPGPARSSPCRNWRGRGTRCCGRRAISQGFRPSYGVKWRDANQRHLWPVRL
jgi:hypothetical protein